MIDYCNTKLSVIARTSNFVFQILLHGNKDIKDFDTYEQFEKYLYTHKMKEWCGFNKSKKGYLETLHFIYNQGK